MPQRSPKRPLRPPGHHLSRRSKPLSISLTSEQRQLLVDSSRSFNNVLYNFLSSFLALPLFIYLHTLPLSLVGHLVTVGAMIATLHISITTSKPTTIF